MPPQRTLDGGGHSKNDEQREVILKKISAYNPSLIRPELLQKILKKINEPEEKVRYWWIQRLVNEYGYNSRQIDINMPAGVGRNRANVFADIVVFRDSERTEPFIIGEVKKEGEKNGQDGEQGASYARNIGAEYHFWSNKNMSKYWRTSLFPNKSLPIGNIPMWVGKKPLAEKLKKTEILPPFRDTQELKQVVNTCHDLIYREGHDPAYAFDELTKLLFLKLYDERETPNYYEFVALADEEQKDTVKRIQELFKKATNDSRYKDVFLTRYNKVTEINLDLTPQTIYTIVQQLQGYSLVNTTENIYGADIKGTVYETIVGKTFRGELGQYFTPRELVEFMVNVINPDKTDKLLDPACGSGGFLIMCIKFVKDRIKRENQNLSDNEISSQIKTFSEHNIYGLDINPRMTRVAKMNMIMHGDGHAGVFNLNGLMVEKNMPRRVEEELTDESLDIIFSNPPFAGYESNPKILEEFDLGKDKKGKVHSITPEVLFVEKIIRLLNYGGKAALVLPAGCFNNSSLRPLRDYIRKHTKIIAVIGLPAPAFEVSGAHNEGNLLFIEKVKEVPSDYNIFVDWASYVGFDSTGRKIKQNDLPDILRRFGNHESKHIFKFSKLKERIDPWYYHPEYKRIESELQNSGCPLYSILDICKLSNATVNPKRNAEKQFRYIETNDVNLITGKIVNCSILSGRDLPNRAKYILAEGDFLIPNHRHCIRGVAIATKEDEGIICSNRFYVMKPNPDYVEPLYLFYLLKQEEILTLMRRESTGEINPSLNWRGLEKIKIPIPDKAEQKRILISITEKDKMVHSLGQQIEKNLEEINNDVRIFLPFKYKLAYPQNMGSEFIAENREKK